MEESRNLNSLLIQKIQILVTEEQENNQGELKKHSDELAKIGMELSKIQFSYKVEKKTNKEYWSKRIENFEKYNQKALEYYNQVFALIKIVSKEESEKFLLQISRFRQLALALEDTMEKIYENPSVISSKDTQQSQWSRQIKNQIIEQSDKCLHHERDMNSNFRDFYENYLKKLLD